MQEFLGEDFKVKTFFAYDGPKKKYQLGIDITLVKKTFLESVLNTYKFLSGNEPLPEKTIEKLKKQLDENLFVTLKLE